MEFLKNRRGGEKKVGREKTTALRNRVHRLIYTIHNEMRADKQGSRPACRVLIFPAGLGCRGFRRDACAPTAQSKYTLMPRVMMIHMRTAQAGEGARVRMRLSRIR